MNFIQTLKKLEAYSLSLPYVNDVSIIDIYEFLNGNPNVNYACVNINIEQSTRNNNLTSYSVVLYYTDRLTEDKSNVFEIWTTAEQALNSIINYAAQIGDVDDGWTIKYFQQQFADYTAGGWVQFNLEVPNIIGDCLIDEYEEDLPILLITENDEYDTANYKKVIVNVPSVTTEEITQAEYDALTEYDPYKIYLITE